MNCAFVNSVWLLLVKICYLQDIQCYLFICFNFAYEENSRCCMAYVLYGVSEAQDSVPSLSYEPRTAPAVEG